MNEGYQPECTFMYTDVMSALWYVIATLFCASMAVFFGMRSVSSLSAETNDESPATPLRSAVTAVVEEQPPPPPPPKPRPSPQTPPPVPSPVITLPSGATPHLDDPIFPGSSFTWSEATHRGTRIPESAQVEANIIRLARRIQPYRDVFGDKEWVITSWYRPSRINRLVPGSASNSLHLNGTAIDFIVEGMTSMEVAKVLSTSVRPGGWQGGLGVYPHLGHVHIDLGSNRRWQL